MAKKPKKVYCVSFQIANPPGHDDWEWVDYAVEESTGISSHGDFGDGCSATYEFRDDKDGAVQFFNLLKERKTIGKNKKFTISDIKIFILIPTDGPRFWKEKND